MNRILSFPLRNESSKAQLTAYKQCELSLEEDEAAVVLNFTENYACRPKSVLYHPMVVVFPQILHVLVVVKPWEILGL